MNSTKLILVGLPMIAVTYGLSRFSYGLMLPYISESISMNSSTSGLISSLSYLAYCIAIVLAMVFSKRLTPKFILMTAGFSSILGLGLIAVSPNSLILGVGIFIAGLSTGVSSPPYAEIVSENIDKNLQNQTNSWINSGTSIGTALTGLVAILLADQWRVSYFIYMGIAIFVLMVNYKLLPEHRSGERQAAIRFREENWRHSLQLIIGSILLGIVSSAYWTFSRDFILNLESAPEYLGEWFWVIIGVAGLLGGTVGAVINKIGIGSAYRISVVLLSASSLTLVFFSDNKMTGFLSPFLFGGSYIFMSGVLIVWGISVFKSNPSLGLGVPFVLLAFGQVIGSTLAGFIANMEGYPFLFIVFSFIGLFPLFLKPKSERARG
ncbi:MFS transporter [Rossellomorea sp. SC111]|uniref:MFS transporter n=1 Tax=Rossellomorea sp. SC111 TaxID=2968985 RepID=UPI00215A5261|nr:MFS transporter [Rossellomorea sp. SC111]MCR8848403.1 MFS transporter [Rossellomorea sp. SC111]